MTFSVSSTMMWNTAVISPQPLWIVKNAKKNKSDILYLYIVYIYIYIFIEVILSSMAESIFIQS